MRFPSFDSLEREIELGCADRCGGGDERMEKLYYR